MYVLEKFSSTGELDEALAEAIGLRLETAVKKDGQASVAFSGGSTPAGLFRCLAAKPLPWSHIQVTLVDERQVPVDHKDSNAGLIRRLLLQQQAASARFLPLVTEEGGALRWQLPDALKRPLDVAVLGMGTDGHTASLFPCCEGLPDALADEAPAIMATRPATAPHARVTFTAAELARAGQVFLHLVGETKRQVLEAALAGSDVAAMPIRYFLHHPTVTVRIFWAP